MQNSEQMRFNGDYYHSLDSHNRIIMPAKIKDALFGQGFTIYHRPGEKCLRIYLTSEWNDMIFKLAYGDDGVDRSKLQRHYSRNSKSYDLDAQGRFVLPQKFVDAVGLKKDIVTIGVGPRAEIWDKDEFDRQSEEDDDEFIDIPLPF